MRLYSRHLDLIQVIRKPYEYSSHTCADQRTSVNYKVQSICNLFNWRFSKWTSFWIPCTRVADENTFSAKLVESNVISFPNWTVWRRQVFPCVFGVSRDSRRTSLYAWRLTVALAINKSVVNAQRKRRHSQFTDERQQWLRQQRRAPWIHKSRYLCKKFW